MDVQPVPSITRKRRRRRRLDRPALSALLVLDDRMKGEVGVLSEDLFGDLFPTSTRTDNGEQQDQVRFVAVTPWLPSSIVAPDAVSWTILPVRLPDKSDSSTTRAHSSLQVPASCLALQPFFRALQSAFPNKTQRRDAPIEIRIFDVVPLPLDTVYITLDTEALRKLDEVHAKFGGGFGGNRSNGIAAAPQDRYLRANGRGDKNKSTVDPTAQEDAWRKAVRDALKSPTVLHTGDLLQLPLPAHPITHAPPPPAKVTACEPLAQGLILPTTRIVILKSGRTSKSKQAFLPAKPTIHNGISEEDEDDTSNETFYSAAEERAPSQATTPPDEESTDDLASDMSGTDAGDLSDDSEDMISLDAPLLPPQSSGVLSSFTAATPRPGGFLTNGIMSPGAGSVYSSFTATTARGSSKGKIFKVQSLLQPISDELVHPKPGSEDDEEARVFVDTNTLVRVGCFSGDWVKLESTEEPSSHPLWGLGSFGNEHEEQPEWRPARIYGIPESMAKKIARYPVNKIQSFDIRSSMSGMMHPGTSSQAYVSPILLANLGDPTHLRISALSTQKQPHLPRSVIQKPRITSTSLPPCAKEVTLQKLSTPLSTDRLLQPSLFAALKDHFALKRRIVKSGDFVGIAVDESLGRAVFQTASAEDELSDELLSVSKNKDLPEPSNGDRSKLKVVAWFKVGNVVAPQDDRDGDEPDIWGGVVSVDAASTTMVQSGNEQGKVPASITNSWPYYLGAKRLQMLQSSTSTPPLGLDDLPKPHVSNLRRRLRELISAATSPRAIHLGLPPLAILITSTQRGIGKSCVAIRACEDLGLHAFSMDAFDILTEGGAGGGDVKTEAVLRARAERAQSCGAEFTALIVKHIDALDAARMNTALKEILSDSRVLIATTTEVDKVPDGIRGLFTHEMEMNAPDEGEREGILRSIIEDAGIRLSPEVDLANIAVKTAALVAGDLKDVVERAMVAKRNRLELLAKTASKSSPGLEVSTRDIELAGGHFSNSLTKEDLDVAVEAARKNFADAIGAPKIPNVTWNDVGGLTHVKDAVMETIQLPLSRPELFAKGMKKRSGILFYGPPGTGKTLLAKAIATEFSLNFFSVKGPELLNMYIGESEANVRRVFQRARDARPCVVFFDELDSVAPKRGNQGDSGGVMDRIVSQLLAELDGMSDGGEGVFVIGATNRPDLLDQALLRPGRFDKMLYLGVSDTHDKQLTILQALTRKFTLHPELSLRRVAEKLPFTYTGADMYALCSDAMLKAITRQARAVDEKVKQYNSTHQPPISIAYFFDHLASDEDTAVMVTEQDFVEANQELVPSVSADELRHYNRVRLAFEGADKEKAKAQKPTEGVNGSTPKLAIQNSTNHVNGASSDHLANGKGKGKGKNNANAPSPRYNSQDQHGRAAAPEESDEEDYIIRTDHLAINGDAASTQDHGDANSTGNGKGKGKGKSHGKGKSNVEIAEGGFGDAAAEDDEMYA